MVVIWPILLAVVLFLLVGTIFEKRIEQALRNFLERRRAQFLQRTEQSETDPTSIAKETETQDLESIEESKLKTPDLSGLEMLGKLPETSDQPVNAQLATNNPASIKTEKTLDSPVLQASKMPKSCLKTTNLQETKTNLSELPANETSLKTNEVSENNAPDTVLLLTAVRSTSLPTISKRNLNSIEPSSKTTSKRSLLTCMSAILNPNGENTDHHAEMLKDVVKKNTTNDNHDDDKKKTVNNK